MTDLEWMRDQVTELQLKNVTDDHLVVFLRRFRTKETAMAAILAIYNGRKYP